MAASTTVNTIFIGVSLFFLSRLRGSEGEHLGARAAQEQRRAPAQQHRAADAEQVLLDGLDLIELLVIEREPVAVLHEHLLAVNRQARDGAGGLALTEFAAGGIDRDELLGAAGAVEAIFSILAIRDGIAPPTINLDNPSVETSIDLVPHKARKREINIALSNSFGFGGTNASVLFRRLDG